MLVLVEGQEENDNWNMEKHKQDVSRGRETSKVEWVVRTGSWVGYERGHRGVPEGIR